MNHLRHIHILTVGLISGILLFSACKKNNDEPDDTDTPRGPHTTLPVYGIQEFTFVTNDDGKLWVRGKYYTPWTDNDNGYYLLEEDVKSVVMDSSPASPRKVFVLKNDATVWMSKTVAPTQMVVEEILPSVKVADHTQKIVAGNRFAVMLKNDGTVWAMGVNHSGQFGTGTQDNYPVVDYDENTPLIQIGENMKDIAAGGSNIYLLKQDGTLWSAGSSEDGKLGYEATGNQRTFQQVENVPTIASITAFSTGAMFITQGGEAWTFGSNNTGIQGIGEVTTYVPVYPHKIGDNVKKVLTSPRNAYFITNDGTLWSCGGNGYGQKGWDGRSPDTDYYFKPIAEGVEDVAAGEYNTIILQNGWIKVAGDNREKQLSQSADEKFTTFTAFELP